MLSDKSTRSYTQDELAEMRRGGQSRTDWTRVDSISDEELEAIIAADDDEPEPDWTRARLVIPEAKQHVNLRIDRDVLAFFKTEGRGYQTRINAVLRAYMLAKRADRGR